MKLSIKKNKECFIARIYQSNCFEIILWLLVIINDNRFDLSSFYDAFFLED